MNKQIAIEKIKTYLDQCQYRRNDILTKELQILAKENRILVISTASDDLLELQGIIEDELSCWDGGKFYLFPEILKIVNVKDIENDDNFDVKPALLNQKYIVIDVDWCPKDRDCSFAVTTSSPYIPFLINEGTDTYCYGMILDLDSL